MQIVDFIIKIENLNYSYDYGKQILSNINIEIMSGEKIAVVGSNGAGKSTFFLNMNGVYQPQTGTIYYKGEKITKKNRLLLHQNVGIVFQEADNQMIASTVLAEVSFGPMNLKLSKEEVERRVEEALVFMNLEEYKNRLSHYLSGGEKKRVSIADIIAMESEVIVFDEPTSSLDPVNAEVFEQVIEKLSQRGKTLLISTHDMDFAYRWADRILVFSDGKIIADDTPVAIFENKEIVTKANLKKPMLFSIYEMLAEKNMIQKGKRYPRNLDMLDKVLETIKEKG